MFTGLIQQVGRLEQVAFQGEAGRLTLTASFNTPLQLGESIAINGTCLTLVEQQNTRLGFDVLRETFDKTALRDLTPGAPLNLERALRMGDPLGGHLVSGHIDGTGTVRSIENVGRDKALTVSAPELIAEMVPKGSIALNGISLTIVEVRPTSGCFPCISFLTHGTKRRSPAFSWRASIWKPTCSANTSAPPSAPTPLPPLHGSASRQRASLPEAPPA